MLEWFPVDDKTESYMSRSRSIGSEMAIAMAAAKVLSSAEHREAKWSRMALRKNWWSCIIPPKAG